VVDDLVRINHFKQIKQMKLVSSTTKNDRHDIAEILVKMALNTINLHPIIIYTTPEIMNNINT
jgi:hypothetical protein